MIIGITGGSGTGKSTLARLFGLRVVDADEVYHALLEKNGELRSELIVEFGTCDRRELAKIVFVDENKLERLNKITHTYIANAIEAELHGDMVLDASVLFEAGLDKWCDKTVAVVASREVRARRIMKRDKLSLPDALARIDAQKSDKYYLDRADIMVNHDEDDYFGGQINELKRRIFGSHIAIYGGTFDPPTLGHLEVIKQAAKLFDKLYVVALVNEKKAPMFTAAKRVKMLEKMVSEFPNVEVEKFDGLLAEYAQKVGAHYSVRGVRSGFDADYERPMAEMNARIAADKFGGYELDTIYVPSRVEMVDCSSTNVRMLLQLGAIETAQRYLDPRVYSDIIGA